MIGAGAVPLAAEEELAEEAAAGVCEALEAAAAALGVGEEVALAFGLSRGAYLQRPGTYVCGSVVPAPSLHFLHFQKVSLRPGIIGSLRSLRASSLPLNVRHRVMSLAIA